MNELLAAIPYQWAKKKDVQRFASKCAFRIVHGKMTMEQGHRNMNKWLREYQLATLAGAVFNLPVICRSVSKMPEKAEKVNILSEK